MCNSKSTSDTEIVSDTQQIGLTFVCPCLVSITVNDDKQVATILAYLFIYS